LTVLKEHLWPGNLRELASVLAEALEAAGSGAIGRDHLPRELRERLGMVKPVADKSLALDATLEAVEKRLIRLAMAKAKGNATKAAEQLGIWRTRLLRRIEALGLQD
jgi:transcriptional regulator with PAS, ATPase and Fis domain